MRRLSSRLLESAVMVCLLIASGCSSDSPTNASGGLSVDLTAPRSGAQVSGTVELVAAAQSADRVVFSVDGTEVGTRTESPYVVSWNITTVPNGGHLVRAEAFQGSERATDDVDIIVNNAGGGVGVVVSPQAATVALNGTQGFTATVVGSSNTTVTWSIDQGGSHGTISAAGLYTAPATLPSPTTATVRATSVADPSKSSSATVTITDGGGGSVQVVVTPPSAQVEVGQNQQFSAAVTGTANTQVTWTVLEGATQGTVSAAGLYTAPATLPSSTTATVRATSVADPSKSSSATVTITGGGGGPFSADELSVIRTAYTGGFQTRSFINDANDLAAQAFFFASCLNGNQGTLNGTLTETAPKSGQFTYAPQPADRMRVVFGDGSSLDIFYAQISGDLGEFECDGSLGFLSAHDDFRYRMVASGFDLNINSAVVPRDEFIKDVSQGIQGTLTLNNETWTVQGQMAGTFLFLFSETSTTTHDQLHIETTLVSGNKEALIAHDFDFRDDFFSSSGDSFTNRSDTVQASGRLNGGTTTFGLQNVVYSWSDTNRRDPIYRAEGTLLLNGTPIGTFLADSASGAVGVDLGNGVIVPL